MREDEKIGGVSLNAKTCKLNQMYCIGTKRTGASPLVGLFEVEL
jgi:hypothetical protein